MRKPTMLLATIIATTMTWVACTSSGDRVPTEPSFVRGGTPAEQCLEGATKIEAAPWTFTASGGSVITSVCLKAGTELFTFTSDASSGCYSVTGIGTPTVTLADIGSGPECKGISNVVFYTGPAPSPSPSPTPSPSPSPEPSPSPSPSPSPGP